MGFSECTSLGQVTLPQNVKRIENYAFDECNSLKEITILNSKIPLNESSWADSAFSGCNALYMVNLPEGPTEGQVKDKLRDTPFAKDIEARETAKLEKIKRIKETTIAAIIANFPGFSEATVEVKDKDKTICINATLTNGAVLYTEMPKPENLVPMDINLELIRDAAQTAIPGALVILGITEIKDKMFKDRNDFSTILFPKELKAIGGEAFANCSGLKRIVIPEGVTKIEHGAFMDCTSLEEVILPNSIKEIESSAFRRCKLLNNINIPQTIESIRSSVFKECDLRKLNFENDHILMKDGLIIDKDSKELTGTYINALEYVIIPDWINTLDCNTFNFNKTLKSIIIPGSISNIRTFSFSGCTTLQNVTILEGVTRIGIRVFWGCQSLENIKIPQTITEIGRYTFYGCISLQRITIPNEITVIEESTFGKCSSLESISLSENITKIEEKAFADCRNLESITIPKNVECIEAEAFANCTSLKEITVMCTEIALENWADTAFAGCSALTKVNLPEGLTWEQVKDKFTSSPLLSE